MSESSTMTMEQFTKARSERRRDPAGTGKHQRFLKALKLRQPVSIPLNGSAPATLRKLLLAAAQREGVKLQTMIKDGELWVCKVDAS